jgi:DnaJ-class molecular chaperone
MSNLKLFLKSLQRSGYPNSKTNVTTIARAVDYDLDFFLTDLLKELGSKKTKDFVGKTFSTLGLTYSPGMKIDFTDSICGKELTIPLFNNEIKINDTYEEFGIVENNKEYIIGKGLGFLKNENERANLIVKFKINYPTKKYTQTERNEIKKILQ